MGAGPSTPATPEAVAHEKAVFDRIRTLTLDEDEFVDVEAYAENEKGDYAFLNHSAAELPLEAVASWPGLLLQDPKNRCV